MKHARTMIILLSCAFLLSGCYPTGEDTAISGSSETSGSEGTEDADSNEITNDENTTETVAIDNFSILLEDLETYDAAYQESYPTLSCTYKEWDFSALSEIFIADKTILSEEEYESDYTPNTMRKAYKMENSSILTYENGFLIYNNEDVNNDRLYSYFAKRLDWSEASTVLEDTFSDEELSFASKEDIITEINEIIESIGVSNIGEPAIYSMTSSVINTLAKEEDVTLKDGSTMTEWTSSDDAYLLIYSLEDQGLSYTQSTVNYSDGNASTGSYILCIVNQDGIVYFNASNIMCSTSNTESVTICSAQTALDSIVSYYENLIILNPISITECCLCYAPQQSENNTYTMTPVWQFTLAETENGTVHYSVTMIDAATGQTFGS